MEKTLGEIIHNYRRKNRLSMEDFSKKSRLSKPYISMLEKNYNPKSKKEIIPTIETIFKCSKAMNMNFETLFNMLGTQLITTSEPNISIISGNDNNSSQSNNNSGTITTITNNYSDCDSNTKPKNHQEEYVHQKNIETLYAIIDELKKLDDENMKRVLDYVRLLTK